MSDPNHQVTWPQMRPDLSIRTIRGTSTNRGYHETWFEVVSDRKLDDADIDALAEIGFFSIGQAYGVMKSEKFTETVQPATVDRHTGEVLPDVPPMSWDGKPFTHTSDHEYYRYIVRRICDSGD